MKKYLRLAGGLPGILLFILAGGCSEKNLRPCAPTTSSYNISAPQEYVEDQDSFDLNTYVDLVDGFKQRARSTSSLTEAHRRVESHLRYTKVLSLPRNLREVGAAQAMLQCHVDQRASNLSTQEFNVLALQTDRYLDARPTATSFIVTAFRTLQGHWSKTRLTSAIDTVLEATRERYVVNPSGADPHIPEVHSDVEDAYRSLLQLRADIG